MTFRVGLVGGRGYTGEELLRYIAAHPQLELAFASSSSEAGMRVQDACDGWPLAETRFIALRPEQAGQQTADAWLLAVPNRAATEWAQSVRATDPRAVIIDLSADHRFANDWVYGLPERFRSELRGARNISNPGCYATAAQLGLLPLVEQLSEPPVLFGVSGFSGAGKTPSSRNDPHRLADNLLPYSLSGHVHEWEISHQLGQDVRFMPHVAAFFRGISMTFSVGLKEPVTAQGLLDVFRQHFGMEPRIRIDPEIPEVQQVVNTPDVYVGGFTVDERDPRRASWVVVLDNLAKGAASQAIQNLNLALGLDESAGLQ